MKVIGDLSQLREARAGLSKPFGLVPTMGYLHQGHLSLVDLARTNCATVGVSIFVNPTPFGEGEDLASYPVDLDRDLELLGEHGVDVVWIPTSEAMYGPNFQTWVEVEHLTQVLEGEHRPGHFRGVTTVVAKLFNAFRPDIAYFGQKDAQQIAVIKRMVDDLDFPIEIRVGATVREADGLAMSSRNAYLNPAERKAATTLFQALTAAERDFAQGERAAGRLRAVMQETLDSEPLARPQYVSVADPETLAELDGPVVQALLSMAVYVGSTRLIDNLVVGG